MWSRLLLNVLMLYACVFVVLGIVYEVRSLETEMWARKFSPVLLVAAVCFGLLRLVVQGTPAESLYPESYLIIVVWCALALGTLVRYLQKGQVSPHLWNGLALGVIGASLTRFLKNWI